MEYICSLSDNQVRIVTNILLPCPDLLTYSPWNWKYEKLSLKIRREDTPPVPEFGVIISELSSTKGERK
jgi:hypothetical protein